MEQGNSVMKKYGHINLTCNWRTLSALFTGRVANMSVKDSDCMIERNVLPYDATSVSGPGNPHLWGFEIEITLTTLGRTPLDERSTRRSDLYLTTQNNCKRRTSMPPPQRDSNPQSQLASDRIPTSLTARTTIYIYIYIYATFKIKKKNLSYCSAPFLYLPHFWCCVDIPSEYLSQ